MYVKLFDCQRGKIMRKFLVWIVTIICPGITFLMTGRILNMVLAFFLQATVIGWIPAIFWARSAWLEDLDTEEKKAKKQKAKKQTNKKAVKTEQKLAETDTGTTP
jgi:hypothetical protein